MPNLESANLQTETDLIGAFPEIDLICTFPKPALAQLLQIAEDVTPLAHLGKLSSEFNINKEKIVQALGIKLPIYVHRLKRHKPTAWSEAVVAGYTSGDQERQRRETVQWLLCQIGF